MNKEDDSSIIGSFLAVLDALIDNHEKGSLCYASDPVWREKRFCTNMTFYSPVIRSKILKNERLISDI